MRSATIAVAVLLAYCPCASALNPSLDINQYAHSHWTIPDGFFKSVIYSIAQTPDGYLWLGTESGLLRFDGVRAVPWQPPAGEHLPSTDVRSVLAARDGRLWIGTAEGLASWKDGKLTPYPELAGQNIHSLVEDREGVVWAAGALPTGKLCAIRRGSAQCYGEDGSLGRGFFFLHEDSGGNLWAAGPIGLLRWKPGPPKLYPMPDTPLEIEDVNGALLISTRSGISRFVDGKADAYRLPSSVGKYTPVRLLRDRNGGLWIGTTDRGLLHIHEGRTDVFGQSDGLSGDYIQRLFEDREGNIWVATVDGLDRFRDFAIPTMSVKQGLSDASVVSVLADRDGSIWFGTKDGLNRWNNGKITIYRKRNSGLPDDIVDSLFQDDHGRIWVSTHRGVAYLENGRFITVGAVPGGIVNSFAGDRAGNLWIGDQNQGLFHLIGGSVVDRIPWAKMGRKDFASALFSDPLQGGLWLGFYRGGVAYFKDGRLRASYTSAGGLGQGRVTGLERDGDGTLWAATAGGLSRLKDGRVATLTSKNGLPCDTVHSVVEDDAHSFWLYTACGLVRIARSELDAWAADPKRIIQSTTFDSSDGVRFRAIAVSEYTPRVAKASDGNLWFLPFDGVSVIDPRHLPVNKLAPPVHIEQITANRKPYVPSANLRLPKLIRDLTIDYTALSLVAPEKVHFRFKLEPQDKEWREVVNERHVEYSNLAPGRYRFRVTACNNSGVWNETGASLDFSIAPAYYQTTWFRISSLAAFLALLWALYQRRIQQVKRKEKQLRDVIDTIPALAFSSSPDGKNEWVNRRWVEYSGLSKESSLGSGWRSMVHPDDCEEHVKKWQRSVATGEPFENESRRLSANGEYRWFLSRAVPLRDAHGNILKWYGTLTDIEDRKQAEQERERLRRLQADLAHVNRVSMMGELAASLSHELRQPITATITNANTCLRWLKRDQPDVEEAREATMRIVKDGNRAAEIINSLRSFYKKDSSSEREPVDVNDVVGEMLILLRSEANQNSVVMRTELSSDLPTVRADRVQLQQVCLNLMLNAIEAMKDTGGELTISSERADEGQLLISVSDTGIGLPADQAGEIFGAFFTTKSDGSGMGLTISRSIIESHGGRLWAGANVNRGATFYFTLPS